MIEAEEEEKIAIVMERKGKVDYMKVREMMRRIERTVEIM
jgi:hypothetical protein